MRHQSGEGNEVAAVGERLASDAIHGLRFPIDAWLDNRLLTRLTRCVDVARLQRRCSGPEKTVAMSAVNVA
jgi:hypothetical protein